MQLSSGVLFRIFSSLMVALPASVYKSQILSGLDDLALDYTGGDITDDRISFVVNDRAVEQKVVIEWAERNLLLIRSVAAFHMPEMARLPVAEVLVRANWGVTVGNFEIDMSDGEVRFKASSFYHEMKDITSLFKYHMQASVESFQEVASKLEALA